MKLHLPFTATQNTICFKDHLHPLILHFPSAILILWSSTPFFIIPFSVAWLKAMTIAVTYYHSYILHGRTNWAVIILFYKKIKRLKWSFPFLWWLTVNLSVQMDVAFLWSIYPYRYQFFPGHPYLSEVEMVPSYFYCIPIPLRRLRFLRALSWLFPPMMGYFVFLYFFCGILDIFIYSFNLFFFVFCSIIFLLS